MDNISPSQAVRGLVEKVESGIRETVFGHDEQVKLLIGAFLLGGHVLLEGPPGIAKTLTAKSFARSLGLTFNRVQFTPDLMPSDVTGVYVFDQNSSTFRFSPGPIFCDILLADEINRTPPKTQSALLEAMEEHFVTIDGRRRPLGDLFFVVATQNPIEHEGTFPLPEAQLDRFLFKLTMSYPGAEQEKSMMRRLSAEVPDYGSVDGEGGGNEAVSREETVNARALVRRVALDTAVSDYVYRVVLATREHGDLILGASPRAGLNLALAAKLSAALEGRDYTVPDDVKIMAPHVLSHRLILRPEILEEPGTIGKLIAEILDQVPVPDRVQM